jgi:hypothetical protein
VAPAESCPAVPSHGIDLVDEDDAWGVLLSLGKEITDPGSPDADEHLDEVRA